MPFVERNWAGNVAYHAERFDEPTSLEDVQTVVSAATKVRCVGSRHSFNEIADTGGNQVSLAAMPRLIEIDAQQRTVTIDGGITYAELATSLDAQGYALANLASLPHISVAGACATATHGSGVRNGNLATAVRGLQFVTAEGDVVEVGGGQDPGLIDAVTVGLGALGIVTRLTLAIEPSFNVEQMVYEHLPLPTALAQLHEIMADGYSVSLFTTWRHDEIEQLWRKVRVESEGHDASVDAAATRFGATVASRDLHPITELSAEPCTEQMGLAGPWHDRLPHFRMGFRPSSGDELQSELFVAADHAPEVMRTLRSLGQDLAPVLKISEVRTVAADGLWLSTSYQRDSVAFHFSWINSWSQVQPVLANLESALAPFAPRPHWGKLTTIGSGDLHARFERLAAFGALLDDWDPSRKFRNPYLDAVLG
jgi:xylitol oxidase